MQRQEVAPSRGEERKAAKKKQIASEEDPEKHHRLGEAALRPEQEKLEKQQMKMKQTEVKAM